jgi:hypothetical protein
MLARTAVETPVVEYNLDAIFSLTANPAWLTDYVLGDHSVFGTSRPGAVSGWPTITVPFGYVSGLPVGVSFLGPRWSEPRLLALAFAFEQATNARRAPELLPTITAGAPRLAAAFAYANAAPARRKCARQPRRHHALASAAAPSEQFQSVRRSRPASVMRRGSTEHAPVRTDFSF